MGEETREETKYTGTTAALSLEQVTRECECRMKSFLMHVVHFLRYPSYAADPTTGDQILPLDTILYFFLLVYLVEIILRIFASGWIMFFWQPNSFYGQMKARYDLGLTILVFILLVIERTTRGKDTLYFDPWPKVLTLDDKEELEYLTDAGRVILSLSAFRAFSSVKLIRPIFFGLLYIMPTFAAVAGLCICVMHFYAIAGCLLMGGTFMYLGEWYPGVNFNSMYVRERGEKRCIL